MTYGPSITVDCATGEAKERPLDSKEIAARDAKRIEDDQKAAAAAALEANDRTLRDRAAQALATNAAFLALASPTNAQTLAQVRALTRECTALIRLTLQQVDDITGT